MNQANPNRIDCLHDKEDGTVRIVVPPSMVAEFQLMAQRAINTWPNPSADMRDFIDRLQKRNKRFLYQGVEYMKAAPSFIGEVTEECKPVEFDDVDKRRSMDKINEAINQVHTDKMHYTAGTRAMKYHYDSVGTRRAIALLASIAFIIKEYKVPVLKETADFLVGMEELIWIKHGSVNEELLVKIEELYVSVHHSIYTGVDNG